MIHNAGYKGAEWAFRAGALLVVVGCGWAWLPLGFMAAGAFVCVAAVTHIVASAAKVVIDEGRITDGATSDDSSKT